MIVGQGINIFSENSSANYRAPAKFEWDRDRVWVDESIAAMSLIRPDVLRKYCMDMSQISPSFVAKSVLNYEMPSLSKRGSNRRSLPPIK